MKLVLLAGTALAAVLLDLTFFASFSLWGGHLSASAALVAIWAVLRTREETMALTPLCGLGLGLLGNEPVGASLIGLAVVALLGWLRNPESAEGRFIHAMGVALCGTLLYVAIRSFVTGAVDQALPNAVSIVRATIGSAFLTVPLAGMVYLALVRIAIQPRLPGQMRRM